MTVYELLKVNESMLRLLAENGVDAGMVRQIEAYEECMRLLADGEKAEWVYADVGRRYGVSRTSLWRITKCMKRQVEVGNKGREP